MKLKDGFLLREVAGTAVLVPLGEYTSFHGMMKLNGSGKFICELLQKETTKEDILKAVMDAFEVEEERASADIDAFLDALRKANALDET